MKGITLTFIKHSVIATDAMGNDVTTDINIDVPNCLIAPITEPTNSREQQALQQSLLQVRIHLPKTFDGDVSSSDLIWDDKKFHVDSDSVAFMDENTPGLWNRYFRAEAVSG